MRLPIRWNGCIATSHGRLRRLVSGRAEFLRLLSSIVMELLAKTAEDLYQTAAGVEADLRQCLSVWQSHGRIDPFPLGAHDASDRLPIAEEL